jgi:hypothetical protein
MDARTIENPVTGERATFLETARQTAGARTVAEVVVEPRGAPPAGTWSSPAARRMDGGTPRPTAGCGSAAP